MAEGSLLQIKCSRPFYQRMMDMDQYVAGAVSCSPRSWCCKQGIPSHASLDLGLAFVLALSSDSIQYSAGREKAIGEGELRPRRLRNWAIFGQKQRSSGKQTGLSYILTALFGSGGRENYYGANGQRSAFGRSPCSPHLSNGPARLTGRPYEVRFDRLTWDCTF